MSVEFIVAGLTAAENTNSIPAFDATPIAPEAGVTAVTVSAAGGADGVVGVDGGVEGPLGVLFIAGFPPQPAIRRGRTPIQQAVHLATDTLRRMSHHRDDSLVSMPHVVARVCWF